MSTPGKRVAFVCGQCGSNDVTRDALAKWSVAEQDWVLRGVLDEATCETCERETSLIEVELARAPSL